MLSIRAQPCASTSTTTPRPRSIPRSPSDDRGAPRATSATRRASTTSASRPRPRSTTPGRRRRADRRRTRRDRLHERRHRGRQPRHRGAPPRRSRRRGRRHLIASAIEHEAVLNTLKALARRGWTTHAAPGRPAGHRRRRTRCAALRHDRHGARVGHARQQRDRHDPADRRARARSRTRTARSFHTDAVQTVGKIPVDVAGARRRSAVALRRTSSTARRAPARCGSGAARGCVAAHDRRPAGAEPPRRHRERPGHRRARRRRGCRARAARRRDGATLAALRDRLETGILARVAGTRGQRRREAARAEHDQHQLRRRRGGVAAHRARPRGHRRVDRVGVLVGHARAVARAARRWGSRRHARRTRSASASGAATREAEIDRVLAACCPPLSSKLRALTRWRRDAAAGAAAPVLMRIVVAMSGGVDSSVAAALLAEQGHDVIGLSMQLYDQRRGQRRPRSDRCCTLDDLHDARRVAAALGIPHYIVNFERQFEAHGRRRTSSASTRPAARRFPCAHCNSDLKFATLLDRAAALGAERVATGHYARVERRRDARALRAAARRRPRRRISRTSCSP